jgi:glycosyltransferase involved in cell wall biosynthesis
VKISVSSEPVQSSMQPVRVLHLVSPDAQTAAIERAALRPVLLGIPRSVVTPQVVRFAKPDEQSMALRLLGVDVHDVGPMRQQFAPLALREVRALAQAFRPHILHAWDYPAQQASVALQEDLADRARLVWSMTATRPPAGMLNGALRAAVKSASRADAIVYTSRLSARAHQEAGFPHEHRRLVEPGIDPELYKPDFATRRRVREALKIPADAFVIGMYAPFASQVDHEMLIEVADELARTYAHLHLLLGGVQVDGQNTTLATLVRRAKALGSRVHVVGQSLDMAELYGACDAACSIATSDARRLDLAAAMLCGVACVATTVDAQGELLGDTGKGVTVSDKQQLLAALQSVIELPARERAATAQRARQRVLQSYTVKRTASRYLRLYQKLQGIERKRAPAAPLGTDPS